ncbi:MAG: glycosyltransferase family 4 protein [Myxococcota bacterium]
MTRPVIGPLAVVLSRFPSVTETFILREVVELDRAGVEVAFVPLLREPTPPALHAEAVAWDRRALYTPFVNGPILAANLRVLASRPWLWLRTLLALLAESASSWNAFSGTLGIYLKSVYYGQVLRARGVRHVHAHFATHPATAAYVMSRVSRAGDAEIPYSLTVHAHDIFLHTAGLARKLAGASFVRTISEFNAEFLLQRFGRGRFAVTRDKFRVIHCGIELGRYAGRPLPGTPGSDRPARLLTVAQLKPYKGIAFLVAAARRLADRGVDVRCDVIGGGPLQAELAAEVERVGLGERFHLLGPRSQAEVAEALASADLFVLPSIVAPDGQMEGIPVSLMEALAAGLPTVATRLSGIPELVVDGRTGYVVPPGDAESLAAAIARALAEPERARALAQAGRALVQEQFEIRGCMERLVAAIGGSE